MTMFKVLPLHQFPNPRHGMCAVAIYSGDVTEMIHQYEVDQQKIKGSDVIECVDIFSPETPYEAMILEEAFLDKETGTLGIQPTPGTRQELIQALVTAGEDRILAGETYWQRLIQRVKDHRAAPSEPILQTYELRGFGPADGPTCPECGSPSVASGIRCNDCASVDDVMPSEDEP